MEMATIPREEGRQAEDYAALHAKAATTLGPKAVVAKATEQQPLPPELQTDWEDIIEYTYGDIDQE